MDAFFIEKFTQIVWSIREIERASGTAAGAITVIALFLVVLIFLGIFFLATRIRHHDEVISRLDKLVNANTNDDEDMSEDSDEAEIELQLKIHERLAQQRVKTINQLIEREQANENPNEDLLHLLLMKKFENVLDIQDVDLYLEVEGTKPVQESEELVA